MHPGGLDHENASVFVPKHGARLEATRVIGDAHDVNVTRGAMGFTDLTDDQQTGLAQSTTSTMTEPSSR